jgi:NADH-quinone oxidoreductase subunit N
MYIYIIRLTLSFLFIIFLIYVGTELNKFIFYSFEFYIVLFFSFISLNLLLISCTFLNVFIFIEFFSLCLYYLIASTKTSFKSVEASIKYFVFGSLSSGALLFGFFLIYFVTGCNNFFDISLLLTNNSALHKDPILLSALLIVTLSLLFKIGGSFFFF